jgi:hypothetical protein
VVEHLRRRIEGPDGRQAAPDDAEVDGGDGEPGGCSSRDRVAPGEKSGEDDSPPERDGDVSGAAGCQQGQAVTGVRLVGVGEQGFADRPGGREQVLMLGERQRQRRRAAQCGAGDAGEKPVSQSPTRSVASRRNRA